MNGEQAGQAVVTAAVAALAAWGVSLIVSGYRELQFLRNNYEEVDREIELLEERLGR